MKLMGPKWTCGTCDGSLTVAPFRAWRSSRDRSAQGLGPHNPNLAERVGFEPTVRCRTHAFQACTLSHSVISPGRIQMAERVGFEPTCLLTETKRFRGAPVMTTSVPLRSFLTRNPASPAPSARSRKKSSNNSAASSASTPPTVSNRWLKSAPAHAALRACPSLPPDLRIRRPRTPDADAGVDHRAEAHQAGLDRAVQRRSDQAVVPQPRRGIPQRHDLGVGRRVGVGDRGVAAPPATSPSSTTTAPTGTSPPVAGPRQVQGEPHEALIVLRQAFAPTHRRPATSDDLIPGGWSDRRDSNPRPTGS